MLQVAFQARPGQAWASQGREWGSRASLGSRGACLDSRGSLGSLGSRGACSRAWVGDQVGLL